MNITVRIGPDKKSPEACYQSGCFAGSWRRRTFLTGTIPMSTPTRSHPQAQPQPQASAVPLAVWPGRRRTAADQVEGSPLLDRLIAEYAPAEQRVLLCIPARRRLEMQLTVWETGNPRTIDTLIGLVDPHVEPGAGLVIGLLHGHSPRSSELALLADVAKLALRPGGLLAVLTKSRPSRLRSHQDQVSRSVHAATAAGFGYLQHVIITEPGRPSDESHVPTDIAGDTDHEVSVLHRTTHHDVTIFRRSTETAAGPQATAGAAE